MVALEGSKREVGEVGLQLGQKVVEGTVAVDVRLAAT
jgi:hypothetical protein